MGRLRIPELVLFSCLIFEGTLFGVPVPVNQIASAGIIVLALTRRPRAELGRLQVVVPLLVIALFYIGVVSMFADPTEFAFDWRRRLLRLGLMAMLILLLAAGRVDFRSAFAGLGLGMLVNAVAFYAGVAPDEYGGYLSGYFEDKNVAGLAYAVFGVLLLAVVRHRSVQVMIVLGAAAMVWDTGSRTSIAALAAGILWILLAPRLPLLGRWILGLLIVIGVLQTAEDFAQVGVFSDREGSDLLRRRIDAASELKVDGTGFFGSGLGEAYVVFDDEPGRVWLFHNSYLSALVEGGWPWLLLVLAITVGFGLRAFARDLTMPEIVAQAATIALLICAWRLGEVLFTVQWALVIAFALYARASSHPAMRRDVALSGERRHS